MHLRPASMNDAQRLFDWRNDPETRANSLNSDVLAWEDHIAWLQRVLANPDRQLFVAEVDGVSVGTGRADRSVDATELSWTIAPEARRKGYGYLLVHQLLALTSGLRIAQVKDNNHASRRIAEACGFRLVRSDEAMLHYEYP